MWVVPSDEVIDEALRNASVTPLNRREYLQKHLSGVQLGDSEPNTIKQAMGVPTGVITNRSTGNSQTVWGTGTAGVQRIWNISGAYGRCT